MKKKIDCIIKNGKVLNFETMQTEIKNIYVDDGKIINVAEGEDVEGNDVVDASGKFVLPGLIDEHTHLNFECSNIGANADLLCIPMGVTTAVDAGTAGWTNFDGFYNYNIVRSIPEILAYIHVSPYGVHSGVKHEENQDPVDFNEKEILKKFEKYPNTIRGLKVRMCTATLGNYGIEVLKRTVEIANHIEKKGYHCAIALHYDDLPDDVKLEEILELMRPGDMFTHIMQIHKETIFDADGNVKDFVKKARERGVIMDCCNGRVHWSFENLKKAFAQGFYPDVISSDVVRISSYFRPGFSLVHAMTVLHAAGMDTESIFKAVTATPAKCLGITKKAGTLEAGTAADICIMDVQKTDMLLKDWWGGSCKAEEVYVPLMTIKSGKVEFRQMFF